MTTHTFERQQIEQFYSLIQHQTQQQTKRYNLLTQLILDFIYNKLYMSHMRDIQRLRQTKNLQPISLTGRSAQYRPVDIYNINFDKMADIQPKYQPNYNDPYNKFLHSKEITTTSKEKRSSHKRAGSNNTNEPSTPGLSVYNFSLKLNQKGSTSITSRRERNLSTNQFQFQPIQMFNNMRNPQKAEYVPQEITVKLFQPIYAVGKGGFGKVWKVEMKKTRQIYAMKQMYKAKIIQKKSINSVMNERNLLAKIRHPFFINMNYAFQDRQNLYLIMDYVNGGDLRYHIGKRRRFTQIQTKFFICNLVIGLQYLHKNRIIHRDIKPQNLVLDSEGYIRITDLGVSRQCKEQNYQDTSGTPGYMAPEVMCRKNHSYAADYFAVGVMAYQMMLGKRPYVGKNRKQIRDQILGRQAMIKFEQLPNRWSTDAADFINRLLLRNPNSRLGSNGIQQLKRHDWLRNIDFARIERKQIKAPYIPISIEQNYDEYKQQISEDSIDDNMEQNMLMLRDEQVQGLFQGYQYDANARIQRKKSVYSTTQSETRRITR